MRGCYGLLVWLIGKPVWRCFVVIYSSGDQSSTVVIAERCHWMLGWVYHSWLCACCALNSSVGIVYSSYIVLMIGYCVCWLLLCWVDGLGNHLVLLYYIVVCVYSLVCWLSRYGICNAVVLL